MPPASSNCMRKLFPQPHVAALNRPQWTIVLWGIVVMWAAFGLRKLELRTDGFALIPHSSPEIQNDSKIRKAFGLRDKILVVVESKLPEGIFRRDTLRLVSELTLEIKKLPGIDPEDVMSLATEPSGRLRAGPIQFPTLLDPLPRTEGEVERSRADATALKLYSGKILSREKWSEGTVWPYRATAILVGVPSFADRKGLSGDIKKLADRMVMADHNLYVVGGPVAESLLGEYVLSDLRRLVPLTITIMVALLFWIFRSIGFLLVAAAEIAACLVVVFGTMGHSAIPFTIAMSVLPLIVIPVVIADEIHIFAAVCRAAESSEKAWNTVVAEAFDANWAPIAKTGVTTALSGVVFAIAPVTAIRDFGIFLFLASLTCTLWTLTATPILLTLGSPSSRRPARLPVFVVVLPFSRFIMTHPKAIIVTLLLPPVVLAVFGIGKLTVQDSWTSGFAARSEFHKSMERVDSLFDGSQLLYVVFDARPGPPFENVQPAGRGPSDERMLDPQLMGLLGKFEAFLRSTIDSEQGGVLGAYEQVAATRFILSGRAESERHHGLSVEENLDLLDLLGSMRGQKRLREAFDLQRQQAAVTVFLRDPSYVTVRKLLEKVRRYEKDHLASEGIRLGYAGDVFISQMIIEAITYSELWSLIGSLGAMLIVISIMEGSVNVGVLCSVPSVIAVAMNLSLMGMLGVPIGVATSMFSGIAFGVGVDAAIHLVAHLRRAQLSGFDVVATNLAPAQSAIVAEALVLVCGFGVLIGSSVPANRYLGCILVVTLVSCFIATLYLLPALFCIRSAIVRGASDS